MARRRRRMGAAMPRKYSKRKYLWIGTAAIALVLLVLLFLAVFTDAFRPPSKYVDLDLAPGTSISANSANMYYIREANLYCADFEGNELWTSKFAAGEMRCVASEKLICVYNADSASVFDVDKNLLYNIPDSKFSIEEVRVSDSTVALLTTMETEDSSAYIRIFNAEGVELDRLKIENGSVIDFGIYGQAADVWYYTLDTTGVYPICRVTTHNAGQKLTTGMREIMGEIIDKIYFVGTEIFLSGTSNVVAYDSFGEKTYEKMIYGMTPSDILNTGSDIYLAYTQRNDISAGFHSTVRVLSKSGVDTLVQLPAGIHSVAVSSKHIYAFSENSYSVYTISGEYVETVEMEFRVTEVQRLNESKLLLKTDTRMYIMSIE